MAREMYMENKLKAIQAENALTQKRANTTFIFKEHFMPEFSKKWKGRVRDSNSYDLFLFSAGTGIVLTILTALFALGLFTFATNPISIQLLNGMIKFLGFLALALNTVALIVYFFFKVNFKPLYKKAKLSFNTRNPENVQKLYDYLSFILCMNSFNREIPMFCLQEQYLKEFALLANNKVIFSFKMRAFFKKLEHKVFDEFKDYYVVYHENKVKVENEKIAKEQLSSLKKPSGDVLKDILFH